MPAADPALARLFPPADILTRLDEAEAAGHTGLPWPVEAERTALVAAGLAEVVTGEGQDPVTPLVLWDGWCCSRRAWGHERRLARWLASRRGPVMPLSPAQRTSLEALFPASPAAQSDGGIDWQRVAAETALTRPLALITGGPGCGKTTVAGRIVALLAHVGDRPPRTVLAAPTGKAAARLAESVRSAVLAAGMDPVQAAAVTGWVSTLHALRHDRRLAQAEIVLVDEMSMAGTALFDEVAARIPDEARVLLLGDPDQLASVDPGRILGDLAHHPLMSEARVHLRVNWRSGEAPALANLVRGLQRGDDAVVATLEGPPPQGATWIHRQDLPSPAALVATLLDLHAPWLAALRSATSPAEALERSHGVRLLTVLRQGPWGSTALQVRWEEQLVRRWGVVRDGRGHYPGRLLLMTANRADLGLANGDVGVVWPEAEGSWAAWFPGVGAPRRLPLSRLDAAEPAWFLTVHKAQGTQGEQVEVIGPGLEAGHALASREMVYTAITRATRRLRLWWDAPGLAAALEIRASSQRASGFPRHLSWANRPVEKPPRSGPLP